MMPISAGKTVMVEVSELLSMPVLLDSYKMVLSAILNAVLATLESVQFAGLNVQVV